MTAPRRKFLYRLTLLLLALNLAAGVMFYIRNSLQNDRRTVVRQLDSLLRMLRILKRDHVAADSMALTDVMTAALTGAGASQDDYTEYLTPAGMKTMAEDTAGEFGGIGVIVTVKDDQLLITDVMPDTPAERAGLLPGDRLVAVDGVPVDVHNADMVEALRGDPGSSFVLSFKRDGSEELLKVTIVREVISVDSVEDVHVIDGTAIGYISIREFQEHTAEEFADAYRSLAESHRPLSGLILDLRDNPGGLLDVAVDICSCFLPAGSMVARIVGNASHPEEVYSARKPFVEIPQELPLALLVNGDSASAAEVTSSCLKDYGRAFIVGTKTFGKGSVQSIFELHDDATTKSCAGIKVTIAKYYTKNGGEINGVGILPDVEVPLDDQGRGQLLRLKDLADRDKKDVQLQAALARLIKEDKK